ncbi:MAG TPA: RNA polymerase sigma factor [Ktedonosporobacter sp.]|nr:RNA polymerase sigma factor [Ktedonosporobacter sp.]
MLYTQPRHYSVLHKQEVPDGVLVGQAQAGNQRAFELLVSRYHCPLLNYIRVFLKADDQAYDVLQHVHLQLYVSLPILLTNRSLKGWLFQVARNRCLDELRRRRRRAETLFSTLVWDDSEEDPSPIEAIPDPDPLPEEVVERIDLHCSLQEAIASLPPKFRSIVHLRWLRQLSFAEIGHLLSMPENTVKTYFYRSLPHLRRTLASSTRFAAIS